MTVRCGQVRLFCGKYDLEWFTFLDFDPTVVPDSVLATICLDCRHIVGKYGALDSVMSAVYSRYNCGTPAKIG